MKNVLIVLMLLSALTSFEQSTDSSEEISTLYETSQFSAYFGWNRGMYSSSTIHFKGEGYDFKLLDVRASDRQTEFSVEKYFKPSNITIPQTNMGFVYQVSSKAALSFNIDHMKYVVNRGQTTVIDGEIEARYGDVAGVFDKKDITLSDDLMRLEHTDGLNYINFGYSRIWLQKKFLKHFGVSLHSGGSLGFMLPKTNSEILGKDRNDAFHLSGYGLGINTGMRIHIGKPFFLAFNGKGGFVNMPSVRTSADKKDTASQHFFFLQRNFVFGFTINLKSLKKRQ